MNLLPDILEAAQSQISDGRGRLHTPICLEIDYEPLITDTEIDARSDMPMTSWGHHNLEGAEDGAPKVLLVPSNLESSILSRRDLQDDVSIDIGIFVKAPRQDRQQFLKSMFRLSEQLKHLLRPTLPTTPGATWISSTPKILYDVAKLRQHGIFFSVTTHTFRVTGATPDFIGDSP